MSKIARFTLLVGLATLFLGGCATSRSVITPQVATTSNQSQGPAVRIEKIVDQRVFQVAPATPDIPSLSDNAIQNKDLTSRAIARKRNGYGKALGDVLLPEQQTVAALTQTAIEQGFREAGYRVIRKGEPGYDEALPITAQINQFWAWMVPGFWAISLEQRSELVLKGPIKPLEAGGTITAHVKDSHQIVGEGAWNEIVSQGLADLVGRIKVKLSGL